VNKGASVASRNSSKVKGKISNKFTIPTGYDFGFARSVPRRLPLKPLAYAHRSIFMPLISP